MDNPLPKLLAFLLQKTKEWSKTLDKYTIPLSECHFRPHGYTIYTHKGLKEVKAFSLKVISYRKTHLDLRNVQEHR